MRTKRGVGGVQPGDKIRLTGRFLAVTGQQKGPEGGARWTVVECDCDLCKLGRHAATNEPMDCPQDPELHGRPRHIALGNIEIIGRPPRAADQSDALAPIKDYRL